MQGINFITDVEGKKKAIVIDLALYGDIVEDFIDGIVATERLHSQESKHDFAAMKKRLLMSENDRCG